MSMSNSNLFIAILIMASVTFLLRMFPFILFPANIKTPAIVVKLSKIMPQAMIGLLVVYSLKDISFTSDVSPFPMIFASLVVVLIHVLRRNALLSIAVGTVLYIAVLNL